jgi:hypothetical protein
MGVSRPDSDDDPLRASDTAAAPADLSRDDVYHILQTKRRRDVLRYLRDAEGPVRLRELAEQVAAWEQGTTVDDLSADERQRVYISLYQSHLPKLDGCGIVDYDKDRGLVEPTPLTPALDEYLEGGDATQPGPWPRRYAGTVVLCGLFLGTMATGLVPISGILGAELVLLAFVIVTGAHVWSTGAYRR